MDFHFTRVKNVIPKDGEVRCLFFTDKQFEKMKVFRNAGVAEVENPPELIEYL